jgi:hypothetical protein
MSIQNILDGDRTEVMTINPPDVDRFRAIQPHIITMSSIETDAVASEGVFQCYVRP